MQYSASSPMNRAASGEPLVRVDVNWSVKWSSCCCALWWTAARRRRPLETGGRRTIRVKAEGNGAPLKAFRQLKDLNYLRVRNDRTVLENEIIKKRELVVEVCWVQSERPWVWWKQLTLVKFCMFLYIGSMVCRQSLDACLFPALRLYSLQKQNVSQAQDNISIQQKKRIQEHTWLQSA